MDKKKLFCKWGLYRDNITGNILKRLDHIYYNIDNNFIYFYKYSYYKYKLLVKLPKDNDITFKFHFTTAYTGYIKNSGTHVLHFLYDIKFEYKNFEYKFENIDKKALYYFIKNVVNKYSFPREYWNPPMAWDTDVFFGRLKVIDKLEALLDNKKKAILSLLKYKLNPDLINKLEKYLTNEI